MKVFFIINNADMSNTLRNALVSIINNNNEVVIFAKNKSGFEEFECGGSKVALHSINELESRLEKEEYDCIFCSQNMCERVKYAKKYVFSLYEMKQLDYFEDNLRSFDFVFVDKKHKRKNLFYSSMSLKNENAANDVGEIMQFVYDNYLSKRMFPSIRNYDISDYKKKMRKSEVITTWDAVIRHRVWNKASFALELNNVLSSELDWQPMITEQKIFCLKTIKQKKTTTIDNAFYDELLKKAELIKYRYIVNNKQHFENNAFGIDYYYYALYGLKNNTYLLNTHFVDEEKNILLSYFRGIISYKAGDWEKSIVFFERYLKNWTETRNSRRKFRLVLEKKKEVFTKIIDSYYNVKDYENLHRSLTTFISDPIYDKKALEQWVKEKLSDSFFTF